MKSKKYKFIIEKSKTGYSAFENKLPIFTTGKTMLELQKNALEATNLYLEEESTKAKLTQIEFELDFKQFFEFYKVINSKHLAARIGPPISTFSLIIIGLREFSVRFAQARMWIGY